MRYILFDEISEADMQKLRNHLDNQAMKSGLDDIYWAELPSGFLTRTQEEHESCQPYVFGLELHENHLQAELFIRNRNHFGCTCQGYANERQRKYIIDFLYTILDELNIRT